MLPPDFATANSTQYFPLESTVRNREPESFKRIQQLLKFSIRRNSQASHQHLKNGCDGWNRSGRQRLGTTSLLFKPI